MTQPGVKHLPRNAWSLSAWHPYISRCSDAAVTSGAAAPADPARGSALWQPAMGRSALMSHTPQPRVPRSPLPRARQLPLGQERVVADCVLVDPVLLHLVPSRHLQQPSGERRSSVSRGGKPAHAPRARWLPFIISQTISAQAHRLVQATVAGAWGDGNIL